MPQAYFHLGMAKTATTYLQTEFFPRLKGIRYFKKSLFRAYPKQIETAEEEEKLLFTNEIHRDFELKFQRILRKVPDARLIYVFRRHEDWLRSRYKYHIRKNGSAKFHEFFNLESNDGKWKIEELEFRRRIEFVEANSQQPALFLNYDDLKDNKKLFVQRICDYLGCEVPPDFSSKVVKGAMHEKQLKVMRSFSKRFPYSKLHSPISLLNVIHRRLGTLILLIVARVAWLIPNQWVDPTPLIPPEDLLKIKAHFSEDWSFVEDKCTEPLR